MRQPAFPLLRLRPAAAAVAAVAAAALLVSVADEASSADVADPRCALPAAGKLKSAVVPQGTSVIDCKLVGRVITGPGGVGVTVPKPGEVAGVSALTVDDQALGTKSASAVDRTFQVEVTRDGVLKYSNRNANAAKQGEAAEADPGECADTAYSYNGVKVASSYKWFIGDGPQAAGLSQWDAARMSSESLKSITESRNNCGLADYVPVKSEYQGKTVVEANVNTSSQCTKRDKKSVWDAGNLSASALAVTCWWGTRTGTSGPYRLLEADVRYNIDDYDFTNNPTSKCTRQFDYRGVGAHEAGHVFGLGHVEEGHSNLTMYTKVKPCSAKGRSIGRGDLRGLRLLYN